MGRVPQRTEVNAADPANRYFNDFDAVCHVASPQMMHLSPTKYPLPLALVSFISRHLATPLPSPNAPPLSSLTSRHVHGRIDAVEHRNLRGIV